MDNGISDMLSGVLSDPGAMNKIMTLMPAVAQMMNGGGSDSSGNSNNSNNSNQTANEKENNTAETATADDLLSNAEVAAAFKNLITAINSASVTPEASASAAPAAVATAQPAPETQQFSPDKIANIVNMLGSAAKTGDNNPVGDSPAENTDDPNAKIEKTLDTLKNFSSATSPENDHRSKLLLALKPFLKDARKTKIDTAIKYMNAAKIISLFGKNGFV